MNDLTTTQRIPAETMAELVYGRAPRKARTGFVAALVSAAILLGGTLAHAAPVVQKGKSGETGLIKVATCKDGKEYWAPTNEHRGACSGHGGVASWADGSEVKSHGKSNRYRFASEVR